MAAVLPPVAMSFHQLPLDHLPVPRPDNESTKARMPRPGLVEALIQLNMFDQDSSEQDEAGSNDSQDSTGSSQYSHSSSTQSRASSATSFGSFGNNTPPKTIKNLRDSATITSRRTSSLASAPRQSWYQNVFRKLPTEVISCIVEHLEEEHIDATSTPQSYVKDLHSLSLATRAWDRHVRPHLYHTLFVRFSELLPPSKKMFSKPKTRIKSLRRTLRERPVLARYVREIRVLDFSRELAVSAEASIEIRNQLASLVMACPSLERLTGLYPPHFHDYDRLTHALSTRRMLKEKLWVIGPNHLSASAGHVEPLNAYQIDGYIQMHSRWSSLETLILNCAQGGVLDHPQMFSASFRFLPNLKNLHISGFSAYDFNDRHLSSLPATLRSLRLEALPGISEEGLIHHLTTHLHLNDRAHLKSLTLIDMNLHFLSSIASLLGHLYNLRRMTIVTSSLDPPSGVPVTEIWQPFCSSRSLEHLHWEINPWINSPSPEFAHYILAESIRSGGFPRLQTLRAPNDPSGILQSACRPLSPPPKVSFGLNGQVVERKPATCHSCFSKGVDGAQHTACYASSIAHAIERAHDRAHTALFPARRVGQNAVCRYSVIEGDVDPYIRIVAADEEGMLIEAYDSPTFLGAMGPKAPRYALESDVQGCDAALAVVEDVILREAPRFGRGDGGYERRLKWKGVRVETLF